VKEIRIKEPDKPFIDEKPAYSEHKKPITEQVIPQDSIIKTKENEVIIKNNKDVIFQKNREELERKALERYSK
ncbi:MAG: hypothetical protein ACK4ND_16960, partial [Cytophagaceae bacterium]